MPHSCGKIATASPTTPHLYLAITTRLPCAAVVSFVSKWHLERPPSLSAMPSYTVTAATGSGALDGTNSYIYITLVGTKQSSQRTLLDKPMYNDFASMAVSEVTPMYTERCLMDREKYFLAQGSYQ